MDRKLLNALKNLNIGRITVGLDGATSTTHSYLRGENIFKDVLSNIRTAIDMGLEIAIISTVYKMNQSEIPQVIKIADEIGVEEVMLNMLTPLGRAINLEEYCLGVDEWHMFLRNLYNSLPFQKIKTIVTAQLGGIKNLEYAELGKCRIIDGSYMVIDSNGDAYPCSFLFGSPYKYGNLKQTTISRIINDKSNLPFFNNIINLDSVECIGCGKAKICRYRCRGYTFKIFGDAFKKDPRCDGELIPSCFFKYISLSEVIQKGVLK